jgi:hypothetical protein
MEFEINIVRKINADREFVFDWWTDLSPDDITLVRPLKSRRVISKTPNLIVLHDEEKMYFKKMSFDVKVSLNRPDKWVSDYEGNIARARSEYVLRTCEDGTTTLTYRSRIKPIGFLANVFSPIIKPFVRRVFTGEFSSFIRALETDFHKRNLAT